MLYEVITGVMLKLSKWLATHKVVQPGSTAPDLPIEVLAKHNLDDSWQELLSLSRLSDELDHDHYQQLRELLRHNLQVGVVITSYSIHYTKLYDSPFHQLILICCSRVLLVTTRLFDRNL